MRHLPGTAILVFLPLLFHSLQENDGRAICRTVLSVAQIDVPECEHLLPSFHTRCDYHLCDSRYGAHDRACGMLSRYE